MRSPRRRDLPRATRYSCPGGWDRPQRRKVRMPDDDDILSPVLGATSDPPRSEPRRDPLAGAARRREPELPDRSPTRSSTSPTRSTPRRRGHVVLTPSATQGTFYLNLNLVRSESPRVRRPSDAPEPARRPPPTASRSRTSRVEVWHTHAPGRYSGFASLGRRGRRAARDAVTDGAGTTFFDTIYPGWYTGRPPNPLEGRAGQADRSHDADVLSDGPFAARVPPGVVRRRTAIAR